MRTFSAGLTLKYLRISVLVKEPSPFLSAPSNTILAKAMACGFEPAACPRRRSLDDMLACAGLEV